MITLMFTNTSIRYLFIYLFIFLEILLYKFLRQRTANLLHEYERKTVKPLEIVNTFLLNICI